MIEVGKIGGSCGDRAMKSRNVDVLISDRGHEAILIAVAGTVVYKPSRSDISVDLPEPDGPMIAVEDSRGITRLTSLSATCSGRDG